MKLGIDVGGTFIKVFDGKRKLKVETPSNYHKLIKELTKLLKGAKEATVAVAGLISKDREVIAESPNLPFLSGKELKKEIEKRTRVKIEIINDATAAAFGEYKMGSGRGSKLFLCFTLGTGLGGGAVIDGKPLLGVNGTAMETGHTTICLNGWPCHCGRKGCLEAYASSYGLERHYFLLSGKEKSSFEIIEMAKRGEKEALKALRELSRYLAVGVTNLIHTFNPDRIALSGGIIENFPEIVEWCNEEIIKRAFKSNLSKLNLVKAELGEFSGAIGAYLIQSQIAITL